MVIMTFQAGVYSRKWWGYSSLASVIIYIQTIQLIFFAPALSLFLLCFGKWNKEGKKKHFSLEANLSEWGGQKVMLDAFIKYGNLLNGLWQSHWRSLFRCRWLPPYRLSLSQLQAPVREERRKLPPVFTDPQLITNAACWYMRLTDYTASCGSHSFSFRIKSFCNAANRKQTIAQLKLRHKFLTALEKWRGPVETSKMLTVNYHI